MDAAVPNSPDRAGQSLLSHPWFFPVVALLLALGNACDLLGTYAAQPHFEDEANPLYGALLARGYDFGWPGAILGKTLFCLVILWVLRVFLARRRSYYPPPGMGGRAFWTHFLYKRSLTWAQTLYRLPRDWRPMLLFAGSVVALGGPYYAFLGYTNWATKYGWWRPAGFWLGGVWIESAIFVWLAVAIGVLCGLVWQDYRLSGAGAGDAQADMDERLG